MRTVLNQSTRGPPMTPRSEPAALHTLRLLLLAVTVFGAAGLAAELALIEHWAEPPQLVPLATLALILAAGAAAALRPGRTTVRSFRLVMGLAVAAGLAGVGFHLSGNLAFEREIVPDAALGALLWEAVRGATPLLAPGSLVQLGLVGLVFTWRHPALRSEPSSSSRGTSRDPSQAKEHP